MLFKFMGKVFRDEIFVTDGDVRESVSGRVVERVLEERSIDSFARLGSPLGNV